MEYVQMTITDWMDIKAQLDEEFRLQQASFVKAGYLLRKIEETEGYRNDGSNSLAEWAHDRYGLSASTVSKYKKINERFSIGGYSDKLEPKYIGYGFSKLTDMLALPDSDLDQLDPSMKREDIRELKAFNKEAEKIPEMVSDLQTLVRLFWEAYSDVRDEILHQQAFSLEQFKECCIPSGNRAFRKAGFFLMMNETEIKYRKGMGAWQQITWAVFMEAARPYMVEEKHEEAVESLPVVEAEQAVGQVPGDTPVSVPGREGKDGRKAAQDPAGSGEPLKEEKDEAVERSSVGIIGDLPGGDNPGAGDVLVEAGEYQNDGAGSDGNSRNGTGRPGDDKEVDPDEQSYSETEHCDDPCEEVDDEECTAGEAAEEPGSGLNNIAPAQLMAVKTFAQNLQSAISAGAWKKALSSCQNLEAVLEKIVEVQR